MTPRSSNTELRRGYTASDRWARVLSSVVSVLCAVAWAALPVQALSTMLFSTDFSFSPDRSMSENIAAHAASARCFVIDLAASAGRSEVIRGVVVFRLESNVTSVDLRSDVVVSAHPPAATEASGADPTTVLSYEVFAPRAVEQHVQDALDQYQQLLLTARRARNDGHGGAAAAAAEQDVATYDMEEAQSFTFAVHPTAAPGVVLPFSRRPRRGPAPAAPPITEGGYGVCFTLHRMGAGERVVMPVEAVTLHVMASASSSSGVSAARAAALYRQRRQQEAVVAPGAHRKVGDRNEVTAHAQERPSAYSRVALAMRDEELRRVHDLADLLVRNIRTGVSDGERMQQTAESTFTRIWVTCVVVLATSVGTVWGTYAFTRHLIVKKKVI